jgi:hypothetical protein
VNGEAGLSAGSATLPSHDTPREYPRKWERWRKLTLYAFAAIDGALDADPGERVAILAEAAAELDGAIDELDGVA